MVAYRALANAIRKDAASAKTMAAFEAFQWTYLGQSRGYVDMFPEPAQRANWVEQLDIYLHDQIEPYFWREAADIPLPHRIVGR